MKRNYMKKYLYGGMLLILNIYPVCAQSDLNQILESIAFNNKTLKAGSYLMEAQKLEAKTGKYLANPTIEFNQLWGDKNTEGNINEMAVVQSFDFPSVYAHKNKLARLKSATYDLQYATGRQQILLTAQQTCLEIIYLRKQQKLLNERVENVQRLSGLYQKRLEEGDANQLDINKILLELLNIQNSSRLNKTALKAKLEQLQTLNGGLPLEFQDTTYPNWLLPAYPQLEAEYLAIDPNLKNLTGQAEIAGREIRLSRAQSLPKFDLGYRRNGGSDETLNGFVIGLSIPLFENKNTVRKAKAQFEYSSALLEDNTQNLKSGLQQLYEKALALDISCKEYATILSGQHSVELLNKALAAGQISMIDYFAEITTLYDSQENYLTVERDYYDTISQLLQYKL